MKMKDENIKQLLEIYFEGKSSLEEEAALRNYFNRENTDPELDCYKPLFRYFTEGRKPATTKAPVQRKLIVWLSSGIAACLLLFFGLKTIGVFENPQTGISIAYIDGKKHTDISSIRTELFEVLDDLDEENKQIFSSQVELINDLFNLNDIK